MSDAKANEDNPLDINGSNFNSDMYMERLLKAANLKQVLDKEAEIVTQSQFLQSEMQTLVYENYNKFISATETVRKMRSDFIVMGEQMSKLQQQMDKMTSFNDEISSSLSAGEGSLARLCATRRLLDKLQFVFVLPAQLEAAVRERRRACAVREYRRACRLLHKYADLPSFQSIQAECRLIMDALQQDLRARLQSPDTTAAELAESVSLLRQLQESDSSVQGVDMAQQETDSTLQDTFLSCSESRLDQHLQVLELMVEKVDILEWVEKCNNSLLSDLGIITACYEEMFQQKNENLPDFASKVMSRVFDLFDRVVRAPENIGTELLVRGLDKFFRKLQAMAEIISTESISAGACAAVLRCIEYKAELQYRGAQAGWAEAVTRARQALAGRGAEAGELRELLAALQARHAGKLRAALTDLTAFLQPDLSFGLKPWAARGVAAAGARLVARSAEALCSQAHAAAAAAAAAPLELQLLLARLCLDLHDGGHAALHEHVRALHEQAAPGAPPPPPGPAPSLAAERAALGAAAAAALQGAVLAVGARAASMLRVSLLARDWLRAPEPRAPRAACRRVLELLAGASAAGAALLPAPRSGSRAASDCSRRSVWSRAPSDLGAAAGVGRLFSERIEVYSGAGGAAGAAVDRAALADGALKIALKALAECARLRTFGRHGLQQLQVDVHFLAARLAAAGHDERLLGTLLEDALTSARARCVDPQLMEPSIVDIICERG